MENRKLIYMFGAIFSIVFALFYYVLFNSFISGSSISDKTLYLNQVGLYKSEESVNDMINTLKEHQFTPYTLKKDDLIAVVCSVSTEEAETKKEQEKLTELNYAFIEKQIVVEDQTIISLLEANDYAKALELVSY